jgi:hypothetical protein
MTTEETLYNGHLQLHIVGEYGYGYVATITTDNGAHPNSPYFEDFEYNLGTFDTIDEARAAAKNYDSYLSGLA